MIERDFIGAKPLYYHCDGSQLLYDSNINALFDKGVKREVNEDVLYAYLKYQYLPGELSLFKGIKKLLPGHRLNMEDGKLHIRPYWGISNQGIQGANLLQVIDKSVERSIGDANSIGVFLSGGLDSSIIALLARRHCRKLHSFSAFFDTFSESEYARAVSGRLGTIHHEVLITPKSAMDVIDEAARGYADPIGDAAILNLYLLAKEAKKHVGIVLTGDGGDELFVGYPWHRIGMRYRRIFGMPSWAKFPLKLFSLGGGNINTAYDRFSWLASVFSQPSLRDAHLYMTASMTDNEIRWMTHLELRDDGIVPTNDMLSPLDSMLALDCQNLLPEKFLVKAWSVAKANDIEIRTPLLGREVVEAAFRIPPSMKLRNGIGKYALRQAVDGLLPQNIVWRKKQGFGTPLVHWLNDKVFGGLVCDRLRNGELIKRHFKKDAVNKIVNAVEKGRVRNYHQANAIWTVFALQVWYDVYFGGGICE